MERRPGALTVAAVLATGVVATGTGALLSRAAYDSLDGAATGSGMLLSLVRLGLTAVLAAPLAQRARRGLPAPRPPTLGEARRTVGVAGVLLGIHFATWFPSLVFTSVAASVTLVTTAPVWVALILWVRGERPPTSALVGIAVAVVGGALVAFGDVGGLRPGSNPLLGNALALVSAIAYAAHLLLGRAAQHRGVALWTWTSVVAAVGAVTVVPLVLATVPGTGPYPTTFWLAAVATALVPQMIGHTSFIWAVRWIPPTLVSVVLLLEPLVSGLGALVLFDEVPGPVVLLGALVVLAGVAVTTLAARDSMPQPAQEPLGPV